MMQPLIVYTLSRFGLLVAAGQLARKTVSKLIKHMQCEGMLLLRQPVVVGIVRFSTLTRQKKKSSVLIVSNGVLHGAVDMFGKREREI